MDIYISTWRTPLVYVAFHKACYMDGYGEFDNALFYCTVCSRGTEIYGVVY